VIINQIIQVTEKINAIALASQVPNQLQKIFFQLSLFIKGITKSSAIGPIKKAVKGEAICSKLCPNQKTLHCLSGGTTFCKIVCSEASAKGCKHMNIKSHATVNTIELYAVKNIQIVHIITFTSSKVLIGFFQSQNFEIKAPQTKNPQLKNHQINHQVSTETKESP
jgi:hypothetical protein